MGMVQALAGGRTAAHCTGPGCGAAQTRGVVRAVKQWIEGRGRGARDPVPKDAVDPSLEAPAAAVQAADGFRDGTRTGHAALGRDVTETLAAPNRTKE
jgi:hypothetical protein